MKRGRILAALVLLLCLITPLTLSKYAVTGSLTATIEFPGVLPASDEATLNRQTGNGEVEMFTAPADGVYRMELWGASGGNAAAWQGGRGAYAAGEITLSEGTVLYLYYGGQGREQGAGGYNGGGAISAENAAYGASGGGASDIRLVPGAWDDFESLKSRIIVAAGGGGAYSGPDGAGCAGGAAGGLVGSNGASACLVDAGESYILGTGGRQDGPGLGDYFRTETDTGSLSAESCTAGFGYGGGGAISSGGGGGYYGGSGAVFAGGGGGSSFISGYTGCDAVSNASSEGAMIHRGGSEHDSGYLFTNPVMYSGEEEMPLPDGGGTSVGHSGDGTIKITLISQESQAATISYYTVEEDGVGAIHADGLLSPLNSADAYSCVGTEQVEVGDAAATPPVVSAVPGYYFVGWSLNGTNVLDLTTFRFEMDVALYALYHPEEEIIVPESSVISEPSIVPTPSQELSPEETVQSTFPQSEALPPPAVQPEPGETTTAETVQPTPDPSSAGQEVKEAQTPVDLPPEAGPPPSV